MGLGSPLNVISSTRRSAPGDNLADGRFSLQEDVGATVPVLSVQRFFDHVLPPLHSDLKESFGDIMAHLKGTQPPVYNVHVKGWTDFLYKRTTSENQYYQSLVDVADCITRAVDAVYPGSKPRLQRLMDFVNSPDIAPVSNWRDARHRPDGYFVIRGRRHAPSHLWSEMGPTGEYKLRSGDNDRLDNTRKALWNMHHSLRDDPRKRFAFAFSIENKDMRLWFASRAEVVVSKTFNFMTQPELLVQFFLVFAYATPDAAGWDPTMVHIPRTFPFQYCITVNDAAGNTQTYRTLGLKSSIGAEALRGRGTRVWRAVPCDPKTFKSSKEVEEVALKDCWVDQTRDLEGNVVQSIDELATKRIEDLQKRLDEGDASLQDELAAAKRLKDSLLVPVIHGIVRLPVCGVPGDFDRTLNRNVVFPGENGDPVALEYIFQEKKLGREGDASRDKLQDQLKGEHRSVYQYLIVQREASTYDSKYHYRAVYGKVCQSLYDVKRLDSTYSYLALVAEALRGLHEAGWVHRDVSAGNILVTKDGEVKLSDWEYAKKLDIDHAITHDIRTGTIDFMAVEVDQGEYLFPPEQKPEAAEVLDVDIVPSPLDTTDPPSDPVWCYNPLHDVESVFWLTKFFTENYDVVFISKENASELDEGALDDLKIRHDTPEAPRSKRIQAQFAQVRPLFHDLSGRFKELTTPRNALNRWHIHPGLIQQNLYRFIENMRLTLVNGYRTAEAGFADVPPKAFQLDPVIHKNFVSALGGLKRSLARIPAHVHIVPLAVAAVRSHEANKPTHSSQLGYYRTQSAPGIPTIHYDNVDGPSAEVETVAVTEKLQSATLGPSTASLLPATSRNETRSQSRTASRPPSRTASRPPSRAASRPPSRTGLRSQSRTALHPNPEPHLNPPSDSRAGLRPESRAASRAGSRSASRVQSRPEDAVAPSATGAKTKRGTPPPGRPASGTSNSGKGKGRATTPSPPVPASSQTKRAQRPATRGGANATTGNTRRPTWR